MPIDDSSKNTVLKPGRKGVWSTNFYNVIFGIRILLRIKRWYSRHQATSGSGDIEGRVPGQKGVWSTIFDDVIFWLRILLRIQRWYSRHQATSGSGDIEGRVPGQKAVWSTIFDDVIFWLRILLRIQRWYSRHQGTSSSGDRKVAKKGCGRQFSMMSFSDSEFYCESNGGTLVTRRLPVPEIEKSQKRGVIDNFRWRHFLTQHFTANPKVVLSSPGNFRFRR
jgi:hypothetical protein